MNFEVESNAMDLANTATHEAGHAAMVLEAEESGLIPDIELTEVFITGVPGVTYGSTHWTFARNQADAIQMAKISFAGMLAVKVLLPEADWKRGIRLDVDQIREFIDIEDEEKVIAEVEEYFRQEDNANRVRRIAKLLIDRRSLNAKEVRKMVR
jgi:hypothetical protein